MYIIMNPYITIYVNLKRCTLSNYSIIGIMKHLGGVCYGNETNKTHF